MNEDYATIVGLDWADQKHDLCWRASGESKIHHKSIEQKPEKIQEWVAQMIALFPGQRIAICMEGNRGPIVNALMGYGMIDLFPVNPAAMNNYRKAFYPSRAKDDPKDARLMLDMLERHRESLTIWSPDTAETRRLHFASENRRKLVDQRSALINKIKAELKQYYPQALLLISDISSELGCAFLMKWPDFDVLSRACPKTIRSFFYKYNSRCETKIKERLKLIDKSCSLCTDETIQERGKMWVGSLVAQIRTLNKQIEKYDDLIEVCYQSHPDHSIFESLPGAGKNMGPRLLISLGSDRTRYGSANDAANRIGISPVTEQSGKQRWIHWRWFRPKFLSQSFVEFSRCSIGQCEWAKVFYDAQRSKGKKHQVALRSLAYKWMRIIYRCWINNEPYDEHKYLQSLAASGSWIAKEMGIEKMA